MPYKYGATLVLWRSGVWASARMAALCCGRIYMSRQQMRSLQVIGLFVSNIRAYRYHTSSLSTRVPNVLRRSFAVVSIVFGRELYA